MHMVSKDSEYFCVHVVDGSKWPAHTCFLTAGLCDCGEDVEAGFLLTRVCTAPTGSGKVRVKDSQLFLGSVVEPGRIEPPSPKGPTGVALVLCTGGSRIFRQNMQVVADDLTLFEVFVAEELCESVLTSGWQGICWWCAPRFIINFFQDFGFTILR